MTTSTLDRPVKGPAFHPVALSRRIKNAIATTSFVAAFGIGVHDGVLVECDEASFFVRWLGDDHEQPPWDTFVRPLCER